jgi:hypothetical protein
MKRLQYRIVAPAEFGFHVEMVPPVIVNRRTVTVTQSVVVTARKFNSVIKSQRAAHAPAEAAGLPYHVAFPPPSRPAVSGTSHSSMHSEIDIPEGAAGAAAAVVATSARGLPSRRLSVAPMMDWTEKQCLCGFPRVCVHSVCTYTHPFVPKLFRGL